MGYCIDQTDSSFVIFKKDFDVCLVAIKQMASDWLAAGNGEPSWVDLRNALKANSLQDAFNEWRWTVYLDDAGDIGGINFDGEKSGQDYKLFECIAPFVKDGGFICMRGEDEAQWQWVFNKGKCEEVEGITRYIKHKPHKVKKTFKLAPCKGNSMHSWRIHGVSQFAPEWVHQICLICGQHRAIQDLGDRVKVMDPNKVFKK
jgi:hypothetical protein